MSPSSKQNALTLCGGAEFHLFFGGGLAAVERCAGAVDKLNVFPVPDGDTGTNLARTIADAVRATSVRSSDDVGVVAATIAAAALRNARGNSGTIFAQLCVGLAQALAGTERVGAPAWAEAWDVAATTARRSVNAPVDGTMLTVARDAANAARAAATPGADLLEVWRAMADAADATVAKTPRMLSVLAQADVVDAGALGLALFLRGALAAFTGESLPDPAALVQPSDATRRVIERASFPRFCTQFLLHPATSEHPRLAAELARFGDSVDVVTPATPDQPIRIHLHTDDPDAAVGYAETVGLVSGLKVEDMQRQRAMLLAGDDEPRRIVMIAVASGEGIRRLFESLYGVAAVIEREDGLEPAVAGVRALSPGSPPTIVLLANGASWATAEGSSTVAREAPAGAGVMIVPTRNAPEGVAAALAFAPAAPPEENARQMMEAARRVRVVCVAADPAASGRLTAVCDRETLATGSDVVETADAALTALLDGGGGGRSEPIGLITMYAGAAMARPTVEELAARLERRFSAAETEIITSGQSECLLWIALESDAGSNRH